MANEYLKRTPTSTGNRKVFTFSAWVKRNSLTNGAPQSLFTGGINGNDRGVFDFDDIDVVRFGFNNSSTWYITETTDRFRDSGSWMNVIISVDLSISDDDAVSIYVNGIKRSRNSIAWPSIVNNVFNAAGYGMYVASTYGQTSQMYSGEMVDVFWVDGQALTPDVFGYYKKGDGYISAGSTQATDFKKGQWVPKAPKVIKSVINARGGFGVNGFYLPMNDSTNFGADFHTTPNSIIKLQEDLSQPKVSIASTAQAGLGYTDVLRADPYAANLVLAIPFVNSGLCTDGTNSGISTGFGDYSHIINTSQTAKGVQLITYNGTTPTIVSYASSSTNYYGSACYIDGNGSAAAGGHIRVVDDNIFDDLNLTTANWTIEGWFNPASRSTGASNLFNFGDATDYNQIQVLFDPSGDIWHLWSYTGSAWNVNDSGTTARPPLNQWSHIAFEKVGTGTTSHITTYINGVAAKVTAVPQNINYSSNPRLIIGGHYVSGGSGGDTFYYDGLVSDVRMYNVAKYKGSFDVPKPYTPVGIGTWRAVPDCTANNFATLNPLIPSPDTLTNGNLTVAGGAGKFSQGTIGISSSVGGKWYFEFNPSNVGGSRAGAVGWAATSYDITASGYFSYRNSGTYYPPNTAYGDSWTIGDTVGIALDADNGRIFASKNGVWQNSGDPVAGTNPMASNIFSGLTNSVLVPLVEGYGSGGPAGSFNFGQNPTFSGNTTAGTYTDSNGKGLFKYEPPSGFLALCEDNLPTPAIKNPGEHFKTVLYTGDGNSRSITGIGFTPDFVWIKDRDSTAYHYLFDSVRGGDVYLWSNYVAGGGEESRFQKLNFDTDGFSLNDGTDVTYPQEGNISGNNVVAWCWRAGAGTTTANTDGTIPSVVSVNQDAGFSIVSYTGNATESTVGHGLNKTPGFILVKKRNGASDWPVYHQSLATQEYLVLNLTAGKNTTTELWYQDPTSSVFYIGDNSNAINASGGTYIAYCWAEIEGFSKFGSYVGNNSTDGPFVYCGFKPALIIWKNASANGNWVMSDSSRDSVNPAFGYQVAESSAIEERGTALFDFLSNGFKIRNSWTSFNGSGNTIIFAAFAESPFTTANAK